MGKLLRVVFHFLSTLGGILSAYALYVEFRRTRDHSYNALCDIGSYVSCSMVFESRWGKGFGLLQYILPEDSFLVQPNSLYGLGFYGLMSILEMASQSMRVALYLRLACGCLSILASIYLGYILFFMLHDLCVVCASTYVINAGLLAISVVDWVQLGLRDARLEQRKRD